MGLEDTNGSYWAIATYQSSLLPHARPTDDRCDGCCSCCGGGCGVRRPALDDVFDCRVWPLNLLIKECVSKDGDQKRVERQSQKLSGKSVLQWMKGKCMLVFVVDDSSPSLSPYLLMRVPLVVWIQ